MPEQAAKELEAHLQCEEVKAGKQEKLRQPLRDAG